LPGIRHGECYREGLGAEPPAAKGKWGSGGQPTEVRGQAAEPPALSDFSTKISHFRHI